MSHVNAGGFARRAYNSRGFTLRGGQADPVPLDLEFVESSERSGARWRLFGEGLAEDFGNLVRGPLGFLPEAAVGAARVVEDVAGDLAYYSHKRSQSDYDMVNYRPSKKMRRNTGPMPMDVSAGGDNSAGLTYYTRRRQKKGRKLSARNMMLKVFRQEVQPIIYRFNGITPFSGSSGYFRMWNNWNQNLNGEVRLPWHIYDVTGVIQYNNTGTAAYTYPQLGYETAIVPSSNTVRFDAIRGDKVDATTPNYSWLIERSPYMQATANALGVPGNKSVLEWVDVKLLLYGQTDSITKFEIALIQMDDEDWCPGNQDGHLCATSGTDPFNAGTSSEAKNDQEYFNWITDWMRPWTYNPIATSTNSLRGAPKRMKFLKRYECTLYPKSTIVSDTDTPATHEYRLFWRANRACNYSWKDNAVSTTRDTAAEVMADTMRAATYTASNFVHPKSRVFLSIRSNNRVTTQAGAVPNHISASAAGAASYDLSLRVKHSVVQ